MSDDVLDLKEFMERVQNNKKLALELFDIFTGEFPGKKKELESAVAANDAGQVKQVAHALKGSSGNLSAKAMRATVLQLEELGKKGDLTGARELLAVLDQQFAAVVERIKAIKQEFS